MFTLCMFVFQASHTLHLSAVNPSHYRFHVEHLQSDDYSKDKVKHGSSDDKYFTAALSVMFLAAILEKNFCVYELSGCTLMPPHISGCPSTDRGDGLFREPERSRSGASHWACTSQVRLPGEVQTSISFHICIYHKPHSLSVSIKVSYFTLSSRSLLKNNSTVKLLCYRLSSPNL